jgi:DNA-binding NtrC family response regulator
MVLDANDLGLIGGRDEEQLSTMIDMSGTLSDVAHRALSLVERRKISEMLKANEGNKSKTAEDLGVSYKTLLNKIRDYNL